MTSWKVCMYASLAAAAACLGLGWIGAGNLWLALAGIIPFVGMLLARKPSLAWLAPVSLLIFVGLAVLGVFLGASPVWMVVSVVAALAAWDLVNFERAIGKNSHPHLEIRHLQVLFAALGLGLLAALAGRAVQFSLPFILMLALILLGLYSLDRLSHFLSQHNPRDE